VAFTGGKLALQGIEGASAAHQTGKGRTRLREASLRAHVAGGLCISCHSSRWAMGNKICYHPRMLLTEDIALHFKSSHLMRDVIPIIDKWKKEGADLCFDLRQFADTFDVVVDTERQFDVFDTDRDGRIDAHEVLMVYILLSSGQIEKKIDTVISVFNFAQGTAPSGINFDEAIILVNACVKGVQKVCEMTFTIPEDELLFHCKSMFDMYRVPHHSRLTQKQFKDWVIGDASPNHFVYLFHHSQGIADIDAAVQRRNLEQGMVFQMLAHGHLYVAPEALWSSADFRRTLEDVSDDELTALLGMMAEDDDHPEHPGISNDRFHSVLRPWNIFNECDLDKSHTLDDKEVEILLWFQLRHRPTQEFVSSFARFIDDNDDGEISRTEWTMAIMHSEKLARMKPKAPSDAGRDAHVSSQDNIRNSLLILANDSSTGSLLEGGGSTTLPCLHQFGDSHAAATGTHQRGSAVRAM